MITTQLYFPQAVTNTSHRKLAGMLAERGVAVDHTTIYRWVQRYAPEIEKRLR